MPAEYTAMGQVSEKTDAYAFGIVLLELLSSADGLSSRQLLDSSSIEAPALAAHPGIAALGWPVAVLREVSGMVERLTEDKPKNRAAIAQLLPQLERALN